MVYIPNKQDVMLSASGRLKDRSRSSYCRVTSTARHRLPNHIKNRCCTRSSLFMCVPAAPFHTTLQYSKIDRTLALKAHITAPISHSCSDRPCFPVWKDLVSSPSVLFAFRTVWSIWSAKVNFSSRKTPKSRITDTLSSTSHFNTTNSLLPNGGVAAQRQSQDFAFLRVQTKTPSLWPPTQLIKLMLQMPYITFAVNSTI